MSASAVIIKNLQQQQISLLVHVVAIRREIRTRSIKALSKIEVCRSGAMKAVMFSSATGMIAPINDDSSLSST